MLVVCKDPAASRTRFPETDAVCSPLALLIPRMANLAEVVALPPRRKSSVELFSKIVPREEFCPNGDPPFAIGRIPVTSLDARLMAEEESTPVDERCAIPVDNAENIVEFASVIVDEGEITIFPVFPPPRVSVCLFPVWKLPEASKNALVPFNPDDTDAVGVPLLMFNTANFADVVERPPRRRS